MGWWRPGPEQVLRDQNLGGLSWRLEVGLTGAGAQAQPPTGLWLWSSPITPVSLNVYTKVTTKGVNEVIFHPSDPFCGTH